MKCYRVLTYTNLDYNIINITLNELNLGKVDFKARGVTIDLKNIHKFIKGKGKFKGQIIFTKISQRPRAIICKYAFQK